MPANTPPSSYERQAQALVQIYSNETLVLFLKLASAALVVIFLSKLLTLFVGGSTWHTLVPIAVGLTLNFVMLRMALRGRITTSHAYAVGLTFATLPSVEVLLQNFAEGMAAPIILMSGNIFLAWATNIATSVIFYKRWLGVTTALWCVVQYILISVYFGPAIQASGMDPALIAEATNWHSIAPRCALMMMVGFLASYSAHILHRGLLQAIREERKRTEGEAAMHLAERANKAKSLFLAHVNHELRTPLNAVLGYAQILLWRHDLNEAQRDGLQIIHDSSRHLRGLIDDVLDMSKIEAQHMSLAPTTIHLPTFFDGIVKPMTNRAHLKNLTLQTELDGALPEWIRADEKRLKQVLLNLLGNAIKFTSKGRVTLCIEVLGDEGDGTLVRFRVKDTGIGIDSQQLETIFTPFGQVGDLRVRHVGTGLGLSISQQLVELMGGQIQVTSQPREGSTFWFEILLEVAEPRSFEALPERIVGYTGPRRSVLIADDRALNRTILTDVLSELGFDLCGATDGHEAVELYQQHQPDIVLMDLLMPNLNGIEASARIRALEVDKGRTPILAVTASSMTLEEETWEAALFDDLLRKPVLLTQLLRAFEKHLDLDWILSEQDTAPPERTLPIAFHDLNLSAETLHQLHELSTLGHLFQLEQQVDSLAIDDPGLESFARTIRDGVRELDDVSIIELLEDLLAQMPPAASAPPEGADEAP